MFTREWDAFYGFVKTLIWVAVIVVLVVHFGLASMHHAVAGADVAVATIHGAMTHLSSEIPLP